MNSSDVCHQISGCPGLFVDAFRGHFLREHTKNPDASFILSHYHGDHYQQLPRDGKYEGPAKIHCTPITARLLVEVHHVPKKFVIEHEYEETFHHKVFAGKKTKCSVSNKENHEFAKITFYDANHCPGACIILIELPDGKTTHLHTGDMRYHPRFQSYPLLSKSIKQKTLDLVYLDTTYCHPKHNFITQNEAVESIASQTEKLLATNSNRQTPSKTLVLLSCYSIGKEKVLYEASMRSKQPIYVSDKKWKMLQCIQQDAMIHKEDRYPREEAAICLENNADHINVLQRCTRDPSKSDLHVIPMGLAGEMWPYFQPNFQKITKYVEDLSSLECEKENERKQMTDADNQSKGKEYNKVVAFIPTGWASATNWNKKNAISTKIVQLSSQRSLHVEVRLISYSEHSTFPELVSFIQYLKPRKVIPTVYSDDNHKRQIENRFRNMLDSTKAKQAFFRSMTVSKPIRHSPAAHSEKKAMTKLSSVTSNSLHNISTERKDEETLLYEKNVCDDNSIDEIEVWEATDDHSSSLSKCLLPPRKITTNEFEDRIQIIISMGYTRDCAEHFLQKRNGNIEEAMNEILSQSEKEKCSNPHSLPRGEALNAKSKIQQTTPGKKRKISDFFARKK